TGSRSSNGRPTRSSSGSTSWTTSARPVRSFARQAADKGPSASLARLRHPSTYRAYASGCRGARRLASGLFSTACISSDPSVCRRAVVRIDGEVDPFEVLAKQLRHREVRLERLVDGGVRRHLDRAAGGGGRALGAPLEAPQQLLAVVFRRRPEIALGRRVLGN